MMELCDGRYNNQSHKTICFDGPLFRCPACFPESIIIDNLECDLENTESKLQEAMDEIEELKELLVEMEKLIANQQPNPQ